MSRRLGLHKLGFHFRLLIPALILISMAVFLVAYFANSMVQGFVQKRFQDRIHFLASYLARNAELGILINNRQMLQEMAENLLQEADVASVRILGPDGVELAVAGKAPPAEDSIKIQTSVTAQRLSDQDLGFPEDEIALTQKNKVIGQVVIVSTMHGLQKLQHKMQGRFLFIALGVACTAMIFFYVLSRSLVAPISRLANTAQDVAKGDHDIRAVPDTVPETRKLALAFNSMLDSLQWSSKALEEAYQDMMQQQTLAELGRFSMTIAHEVKNPLGIIKSSLDMLKKEQGLTSQDMLVGYIEDEIQRLNRLIEDFLLFSKPAKAALVPIEMKGFLLHTVRRFEMQFRTGDIHIETCLPSYELWIHGDQDLLTRAIHNLLKNGIEATNLQGVLDIFAEVSGKHILVRIRDEGAGIDPGLQEQIFEPFFTTRSQGTGLGLAYVAQVIAVHKGRIEAGNWDKGAEFRITLPLLGNE